MIKILILVGNYLPGYKSGGALRSIVNMIERLGSEFEFKIITSDRDIGDSKSYSDINIDNWNTVGKANVYYLSPKNQNIKNISSLIKQTPHDLIYLNSFFNPAFTIYPLIGRKLHQFPKKPVVVATRGEFADGALKIKKYKKTLYLLFANFFGLYQNICWQASSEFEAKDIKRVFRKNSSNIKIAPNIPKYLDPSAKLNHIPKKHNQTLKICFLGRIAPIKNLDYALNILKRLKIKVQFDIYGPMEDKNYWKKCLEYIENLPPTINTNYQGAIENSLIYKMFQEYDLLFLPTKGENFGHVILESMSAGTPVLISDTTPWKNLKNLGAGWDISLNSPKKFISAIEEAAMYSTDDFQILRNSTRNYAESVVNDVSILNSSRELFMDAMEMQNV